MYVSSKSALFWEQIRFKLKQLSQLKEIKPSLQSLNLLIRAQESVWQRCKLVVVKSTKMVLKNEIKEEKILFSGKFRFIQIWI